MEDLVESLANPSWSKKARDTLSFSKDGKPILRAYASILKEMFNWMVETRRVLPMEEAALAEFIVYKAEKSPSGRPASALKHLKYAFRYYAISVKCENLFLLESIRSLKVKTIQKYTTSPLIHVASFHDDLETV